MLRDGLLSPHSKLLPQNIVSDPPLVAMDGNRQGSVVSGKRMCLSLFMLTSRCLHLIQSRPNRAFSRTSETLSVEECATETAVY